MLLLLLLLLLLYYYYHNYYRYDFDAAACNYFPERLDIVASTFRAGPQTLTIQCLITCVKFLKYTRSDIRLNIIHRHVPSSSSSSLFFSEDFRSPLCLPLQP